MTCPQCGHPLVWAWTATGSLLTLQPDAEGPVAVIAGKAVTLDARLGRLWSGERYKYHECKQ